GGERDQVLEARLGIQLEAEVGELDGDLRRQLTSPDLVEHAQVLVAHAGGFVAARDLLPQMREHAAEPGPREAGRGVERGRQVFPRHEAPYGAAEEGASSEGAGEPGGAGGAEQQAAGEG